MTEKPLNIYQRVRGIIEKGKALGKTGNMTGAGSYKFHQTDVLIAFLRPELVEAGIVVTTSVEKHEYVPREYEKSYGGKTEMKIERTTIKHVRIRLTNVDDPEDFIEGVEVGYGVDPQDKGPGKATSYAVKTWLINQFMLRGQPDENTQLMEGINEAMNLISDAENAMLRKAVEKTGSDEARFFEKFEVDGYENFTKSKFNMAMTALKKKADTAGSN